MRHKTPPTTGHEEQVICAQERRKGKRPPSRWWALALAGTFATALVTPAILAAPAGAGTNPVTALAPIAPNSTGTGTGISGELSSSSYNYVYVPTNAAQRQNVLTVFLGGGGSVPSSYTTISQDAASDGYGTIDLRYPDSTNLVTVGGSCALSLSTALANQCFSNERGVTIFGNNVAYAAGWPTYSSLGISVSQANSIVNRLVNLIDYLSVNDTGRSSYWSQFLVQNANSPYTTAHFGHVYPNWSQIVVAGHSDGGGMAAFIGSHIAVRGVIMFSSVNDNAGGASATWITASSITPLNQYWGLANQDDIELGYSTFVLDNWADFGGAGIGHPTNTSVAQIGDGSGNPEGSHQLETTSPTCTASGVLTCHDSTAVNPSSSDPDLTEAWDYLFNAAAAG